MSFDPIFQYRHTKYFVDWGHLPAWDELSYYTGREHTFFNYPPFIFYLTGFLFWLVKGFGFSLMTLAAYASAIYGAMICVAAFLLGRELSNEYGGLMAAALIGNAPQILIRTFGSSYDTDQLVLFFIVLTTYLGIRALRKRDVSSFCLATIGFTAFMLTWNMFLYTLVIAFLVVVTYFVLSLFKRYETSKNIAERFVLSLMGIKNRILILIGLFISLIITNVLTTNFRITIFDNLFALFGFVQRAESWIVNISIAELQPFSIFNFQGWVLAMGRIITGDNIVDSFLVLIFFVSISFGIVYNFKKKNLGTLSVLITLFLVAIVTTFRGIRFTEFSSAFFLILIGAGFGNMIYWSKERKFLRTIFLGLYILTILIAFNSGLQLGPALGPDQNANWDSAWEYLKTKTPELSLVGTWWDPGHMITGLAERRVVADGAHCTYDCKFTINDRITDLGKIMAISDENESLRLIRKYQGTSPEVYWIASDDLIAKFQWLQYFGTGCDARYESKCPLYMMISESSRSFDEVGNIIIRNYDLTQQSRVMVYNANLPIPILVQGINAALFDEFIVYNGTQAIPISFTEEELNSVLTGLQPLERQLNIRFTNQTIPMTVWLPRHFSYLVIIPPNLRNSVFTKMFMLEGDGLEHFEQVFRNEQVKIYKVV